MQDEKEVERFQWTQSRFRQKNISQTRGKRDSRDSWLVTLFHSHVAEVRHLGWVVTYTIVFRIRTHCHSFELLLKDKMGIKNQVGMVINPTIGLVTYVINLEDKEGP